MDGGLLNRKMFAFYMANSFLNGAENFVILPSSLYYINYLGSTKAFLGMVLAMRSIGFVLSAPALGKLADKVVDGDVIFFASLIGHVIGNLIYAIPVSAYYPLFGRFVMGVSGSALGIVYGETAKKTPLDELAKRLLILSAMYNFGTCLGPLIGGLLQFKIRIFTWAINPGNSPAVVMMLVWAIVAGAWLVCFAGDYKEKRTVCRYKQVQMVSQKQDGGLAGNKSKQNWPTLLCLLYLTFVVACINATAEIGVPLIATKLFHLTLLSIKMIFANGIGFIFLVYTFTYAARTWLNDRFLYTLIVALQVISPLTLGFISVFWDYLTIYGAYILVPFLSLGMAAQVANSFSQSLITKVTEPGDVSFYQSISCTVFHVGILVTDAIVGFIFKDAPLSLTILSCCFIMMWIIGVVWLIVVAYKHLH